MSVTSSSSLGFSPMVSPMSPMSPMSPISHMSPMSSLNSISSVNQASYMNYMSPVVVTPPRNTLIYTPRSSYTTYNNANSPVSDAPIIPSLNLSYSRPLLSSYENLNADPRIHHRLVKFFRFKILDNWLYDDMSKLLGYIKISNGKPSLINNTEEYINNKDSNKDEGIKIRYIEKNILSIDAIYKILTKFTSMTNTNWVDLPKNEKYVKQALEIGIRKQFKKLISDQ